MWAGEISLNGSERVCFGVEVKDRQTGRSELEQALGHKLEKSALQNHEMFLNSQFLGI